MKLSYAEVKDLEQLLGILGDCDYNDRVPFLTNTQYLMLGLMQGKMMGWLRENAP